MTGTPLDQRERDELCDLFLEVGPDAPTLCEGWTAHDLAAHLAVREHEPLAASGILIERFAPFTARRQAAWKARGFETLVATLRTPALLSRVPGARVAMNLNEFAVHHEDVRRANGLGRRTDRPDLDDALWKLLGGQGRMATRKLGPFGLDLVRPDGTRRTVHKGTPTAELIGHPLELALYLNGRRAHAEVELTGAPEAVAAVEAASFGI